MLFTLPQKQPHAKRPDADDQRRDDEEISKNNVLDFVKGVLTTGDGVPQQRTAAIEELKLNRFRIDKALNQAAL